MSVVDRADILDMCGGREIAGDGMLGRWCVGFGDPPFDRFWIVEQRAAVAAVQMSGCSRSTVIIE